MTYVLVTYDGVNKSDWICNNIALPVIVGIDAIFNRQPYYANFHGVFGVIVCWCFIFFSLIYYKARIRPKALATPFPRSPPRR